MKRAFFTLLLAAVMLLSLAACGGTNGQTQRPDTGSAGAADGQAQDSDAGNTGTAVQPASPAVSAMDQIVIGTASAIETATRDEYAFDMLASGVSELPLICQDAAGAYHPLLADFSTEDATTWTYTILEGMTWSDGQPVTAGDILYTLQYEDANGGANLVSQTDSEGKVTEAKYSAYALSDDNRSISLTLAAPNVRALSDMTSFRPLPKHIYEGKTELTDEDKRVSCGPYMLERFDKSAGTLSFTVNPYYPGTPHVSKIIYRMFGSDDTMYMALQNGDIDMVWNYSMGVPATYQDVLGASDGLTLLSVPAVNVPAVLAFNNAKGPFADENLRKAVSYALDYEAFKTYFGSAYAQTPDRGFVPSTTTGYRATEKLATDWEKAAEYLAASGYTEKNADGFYVDENGSVLGFTLTCNAGKETHVGCAELVKTQLEAFGIQVTLEAIDGDSYNAKTSNKFSENNITMEAAIYGYTAAGMGMGSGLATIYVDGTHAVQGGCQVFDGEFQDIKAELAGAATLEEYRTAAGRMQDFYAEHTPLVALYWDSFIYAHASRLENITADAVFGLNHCGNWFSVTEK